MERVRKTTSDLTSCWECKHAVVSQSVLFTNTRNLTLTFCRHLVNCSEVQVGVCRQIIFSNSVWSTHCSFSNVYLVENGEVL